MNCGGGGRARTPSPNHGYHRHMTATLTAHRGEILHFLDDPGAPGRDAADAWRHFPDGALVVEDGIVAACGDAAETLAKFPAARVAEHRDCLIVPGLIDAHIHFPQVDIIAAYGAQLLDWLQRHTYPAEARFAEPAHAAALAEIFLDELLRNGTTTALVFGSVHPQSVDALFAAAHARNLRLLAGKAMMDRNAPEAVRDTAESSYQDSAKLLAKWHRKGRLGYAVTPRFAPTSSERQLQLAGRLLADNPGVHLQTHIAENTRECAWVAELFPHCRDYLDVYDRHGLLGRRAVLAHGIHLNAREWARLAEADANLAFCPTSNLFMGSGLFDLRCADEHRARVGLGSDVGGGDSFSLLRVINEAYKVEQLQGRNLPPLRALYLATLGGARALDLQDVIGNFAPGKEADFIKLNYRATPLITRRLAGCRDLEEKLFALLMLGDDRAVDGVWVMGERWGG